MNNSSIKQIISICTWIMKMIFFSIIVHVLIMILTKIGKINNSEFIGSISFNWRLYILISQFSFLFIFKFIVRKVKKENE